MENTIPQERIETTEPELKPSPELAQFILSCIENADVKGSGMAMAVIQSSRLLRDYIQAKAAQNGEK